MKAELVSKEKKITKKGKDYFLLEWMKEDGTKKKLGYFNYAEGEKLIPGFMYDVITKSNGEYENIVSITPAEQVTEERVTEEPEPEQPYKSAKQYDDEHSRKINKAQCLNVAATLMSNPENWKSHSSTSQYARQVLDLGEEIYKEAKERRYFEEL